jgi:hypothetical protein
MIPESFLVVYLINIGCLFENYFLGGRIFWRSLIHLARSSLSGIIIGNILFKSFVIFIKFSILSLVSLTLEIKSLIDSL